jgi:hypothetical protein
MHCGRCGNGCPLGNTCTGGACTSAGCMTGWGFCGGVCTDVQRDNNHCGMCFRACPSGQACVSGAWASACTGEVLPGTESCNGVDDNCDGTVDDPFTRLPPSSTPRVLVYGPTDYNESAHVPTGSIVTVATESQWRSMTSAQFGSYNLLVIGDKNCSGPTTSRGG